MAPRSAPRPPRSAEEEARARAERRTRALESPLDVRPKADARFVHLEVRNPLHGTRYDVLFPAFPALEGVFCTCTDFGRRGIGTCKHVEAAVLWTSSHPEEVRRPGAPSSTGRLWAEIDRRGRPARGPKAPEPLRIRRAGRPLVEPGADPPAE